MFFNPVYDGHCVHYNLVNQYNLVKSQPSIQHPEAFHQLNNRGRLPSDTVILASCVSHTFLQHSINRLDWLLFHVSRIPKLIYFYFVSASINQSVDSNWLKEPSSLHQTYLPTVVKTVQQKNMEPKKSHRSGYCSQMDLKPVLIFCSSSTTSSLCVCLVSEKGTQSHGSNNNQ